MSSFHLKKMENTRSLLGIMFISIRHSKLLNFAYTSWWPCGRQMLRTLFSALMSLCMCPWTVMVLTVYVCLPHTHPFLQKCIWSISSLFLGSFFFSVSIIWNPSIYVYIFHCVHISKFLSLCFFVPLRIFLVFTGFWKNLYVLTIFIFSLIYRQSLIHEAFIPFTY